LPEKINNAEMPQPSSKILLDLAAKEMSALFDVTAKNLFKNGYSVQKNALPQVLSQILWDELNEKQPSDFNKAGIGRNKMDKINFLVRTDEISWIEGTTNSGSAWLTWIASLQAHLNEKLFLGLFSFESHFARYQKGDFYQKHQDSFLGDNNRTLSIVIYLNKDWAAKDGGELILYTNPDEIRIAPEFGTLVVFLSKDVPHEVLMTNCNRHSIAGWFRTINTLMI